MLKYPDVDYIVRFEQLHALVALNQDARADEDALKKMQWCYQATYVRDGVFKGDVNHQNAFIWPYQLEDDLTTRMQARQTIYIIIAAHLALLVQNSEFTWYMVGWSNHIIAGISQILDCDYRGWLDWPIQRACGMRSEKNRNDITSIGNVDVAGQAVRI